MIPSVGTTVQKMNEIGTTIPRWVQQQQGATSEISQNAPPDAVGSQDVSRNIVDLTRAAAETSSAAGRMLEAAGGLSQQAEKLGSAVTQFVAEIRGTPRGAGTA